MNIAEKLSRIDELQSQLENKGKLPADVLKKINYKFRLDWNYYSNNMEGNTLTKDETRSIMIGNITIHGKPIRDVLEMRGHDDAITTILKIGKGELNISEKRIKDIHHAIMHEETDDNRKKIGAWKSIDNYILNYKDERFDFTPAAEVAEEMHKLINWLAAENDKIHSNSNDSLHPVLLAIEFHLRYLTIHPFYDGNGRTARILMNLILIAKGYPPLIIKSENKTQYYQYIADIQGYNGPKDFYYNLMLDLLIRSLELVQTAIEGGDIDDMDDTDKKIELLKTRLNKPDVVTEHKSLHAINEVLGNSVFPLLEQLEEKLKKLNELFLNVDRTIHYTEAGSHQHQLGNNESRWGDFGSWLKNRNNNEAHEKLLSEFTYQYQLKGYKKTLKLQYLTTHISFSFQEFDYSIRANHQHQSERRFGYSEAIDKKMISKIVGELIDKVLNEIAAVSDIKDEE